MQTPEKETSNLIRAILVVHLITAGIYAGGCLYLAFVDLPLFQSLTADEYSRAAKVWLPKAGRWAKLKNMTTVNLVGLWIFEGNKIELWEPNDEIFRKVNGLDVG